MLTVRDRSRAVVVAVMKTGNQSYRGSAKIRLTDFGLKPPSAALGLVGTKDEMTFAFVLVERNNEASWRDYVNANANRYCTDRHINSPPVADDPGSFKPLARVSVGGCGSRLFYDQRLCVRGSARSSVVARSSSDRFSTASQHACRYRHGPHAARDCVLAVWPTFRSAPQSCHDVELLAARKNRGRRRSMVRDRAVYRRHPGCVRR